jgi:phosphate transport system permease protein
MQGPTGSGRLFTDKAMRAFCWMATLAAVIPLISMLVYVFAQGWHRFDWAFFTNTPRPVGVEGGGMANAIAGTLELVGIAFAFGVPIGLLAGLYLAEFGGNKPLAKAVRLTSDVLSGVPSIVTGIFAYQIIVRPMGHFSAWAGGIALGTMMVPVVTRSTEELVKMVPKSLREAGMALGLPYWRVTTSLVLRTAGAGIATTLVLAGTRVAGETAPLLFTAFNNQYWSSSPNQPTASLTVQLFTMAISPFDDWHAQAWTGALVLLLMVALASLAVRLAVRGPRQTSL